MFSNKGRHNSTKLGSDVVQELKVNQRRILIDSLEIGIPAPEQILALGERQLPNGIKVGQLLNSKTLNYKKFTPHRDGLFCERIFGPVQSFVCACGKRKESVQSKARQKGKIETQFCPKCQVEYISKSVRRHRLGHIKLFAPVTHIWYLKGRPSYLSLFLGKRKKAITSLAYCNAYLVEQAYSDLEIRDLFGDITESIDNPIAKTNLNIWPNQTSSSYTSPERACVDSSVTKPSFYTRKPSSFKEKVYLPFAEAKPLQTTFSLQKLSLNNQNNRLISRRKGFVIGECKSEFHTTAITTFAKAKLLHQLRPKQPEQSLTVVRSGCYTKGKSELGLEKEIKSSTKLGIFITALSSIRNREVTKTVSAVSSQKRTTASLHTHLDKEKRYRQMGSSKLNSECISLSHLGSRGSTRYDEVSVEKSMDSLNTTFFCEGSSVTNRPYIRTQTLPFLPSLICPFYLRDCLISFLQSSPCVEDIPIPTYCQTPRRYPLRDVHKFLAELRSTNVINKAERLTHESIAKFTDLVDPRLEQRKPLGASKNIPEQTAANTSNTPKQPANNNPEQPAKRVVSSGLFRVVSKNTPRSGVLGVLGVLMPSFYRRKAELGTHSLNFNLSGTESQLQPKIEQKLQIIKVKSPLQQYKKSYALPNRMDPKYEVSLSRKKESPLHENTLNRYFAKVKNSGGKEFAFINKSEYRGLFDRDLSSFTLGKRINWKLNPSYQARLLHIVFESSSKGINLQGRQAPKHNSLVDLNRVNVFGTSPVTKLQQKLPKRSYFAKASLLQQPVSKQPVQNEALTTAANNQNNSQLLTTFAKAKLLHCQNYCKSNAFAKGYSCGLFGGFAPQRLFKLEFCKGSRQKLEMGLVSYEERSSQNFVLTSNASVNISQNIKRGNAKAKLLQRYKKINFQVYSPYSRVRKNEFDTTSIWTGNFSAKRISLPEQGIDHVNEVNVKSKLRKTVYGERSSYTPVKLKYAFTMPLLINLSFFSSGSSKNMIFCITRKEKRVEWVASKARFTEDLQLINSLQKRSLGNRGNSRYAAVKVVRTSLMQKQSFYRKCIKLSFPRVRMLLQEACINLLPESEVWNCVLVKTFKLSRRKIAAHVEHNCSRVWLDFTNPAKTCAIMPSRTVKPLSHEHGSIRSGRFIKINNILPIRLTSAYGERSSQSLLANPQQSYGLAGGKSLPLGEIKKNATTTSLKMLRFCISFARAKRNSSIKVSLLHQLRPCKTKFRSAPGCTENKSLAFVTHRTNELGAPLPKSTILVGATDCNNGKALIPGEGIKMLTKATLLFVKRRASTCKTRFCVRNKSFALVRHWSELPIYPKPEIAKSNKDRALATNVGVSKWHTTGAKEILLYTGGGALESLLKRFNTQLLCQFLLGEIQILRGYYKDQIIAEYNKDQMQKRSFGKSEASAYSLNDELRTQSIYKSANLFCRRIYRTTRRLKVVQLLMRNGRRPEWMMISILPVLPPDLRPVLQMGENLIVASDLNTLYQRVIYRNNRHYKGRFLDFHFVSSIQRLVQDAVDRLIENGKGGSTPFLTPGGRPLKSLSDILKGKRGRFRFNLLGKRVDFSGRSVIVVSPNLKIHECGLPREMALELYKYLLIRQLLLQKRVSSIVNAKKLIKLRKPFIWDILREIIYYHPLLLNRAPTLHRLGIQAFQPKLTMGNAILLHPLVCAGFNADFDGDQMGVHLPLSPQARAEAWDLLWSRNNLLSPATGQPILLPSQDMVLGFYYMTALLPYGTSFRPPGKGLVAPPEIYTSPRNGTLGLWHKQYKTSNESQALLRVRSLTTLRLFKTLLGCICVQKPRRTTATNNPNNRRNNPENGLLKLDNWINSYNKQNGSTKYDVRISPLGVNRLSIVSILKKSAYNCVLPKKIYKRPINLPIVHVFLDLSQVVHAYQKKQIDIHTPIWLKWVGNSENGDKSQVPLEIRMDTFGHSTQIYQTHKYKNRVCKNENISLLSRRAVQPLQKRSFCISGADVKAKVLQRDSILHERNSELSATSTTGTTELLTTEQISVLRSSKDPLLTAASSRSSCYICGYYAFTCPSFILYMRTTAGRVLVNNLINKQN